MRIFVLAKAPVPGRVKTRLAATAGEHVAARVYRQVTEQVLRVAVDTGMPVTLACAPGPAHPFFHQLRRRHGVALCTQPAGGLGRRLQLLLHGGVRSDGTSAVVGADCAGLTGDLLRGAAQALAAGNDGAIAPAQDGGYVLLAVRRAYPALFRGVPWSTSAVLATTRRRARSAGIQLTQLPTSWDLDDERDWRRWRRGKTSVPLNLLQR